MIASPCYRYFGSSDAPSAPLEHQGGSFGDHPKSNHRFFLVRNKLHELKSYAFSALRRPSGYSYSPLAGDREHSTPGHAEQAGGRGVYAPLLTREGAAGEGEMVAIVTSSGQVLPVTASPITSVNMV